MSRLKPSALNLFLEQNLRVDAAFRVYEARWLGLHGFIQSLSVPKDARVGSALEGVKQADALSKKRLL